MFFKYCGSGEQRARVGGGLRAVGLAIVVAASVIACASASALNNPNATPAAAAASPAAPEPAAMLDDPPAPVGKMPTCRGPAFDIDLLEAIAALPDDTLEAQREQLRDWVWNITLARSGDPNGLDSTFSAIADEPLIRDDAFAHVLALQTGTARATATKAGEVVVLVDAANEPDLKGRVLDSVDEQSLTLGRIPENVRVFGFELEPGTAVARVCQIDEYDRSRLASTESGYRRALVTSLPELEGFLSGGVDLLTAECTDQGIALSGRQRIRAAGAPVTPAHIAALAQELKDHYIPPAQFGTSLAALSPERQADVLKRAAAFDGLAAAVGGVPSVSPWADENERFAVKLLGWKHENPGVSSVDLLLSASLQAQFDGKLGFSLDPEYTLKDVLSRADELLAAMSDGKSLVRKLREWGMSPQEAALFDISDPRVGALRSEFARARASLAKSSDDEVLTAIWNMESQDSNVSDLVSELRVRSGKQCARYDGPLAGTEAGMTFFYTDVSAKFFARDFDRRSPEGVVPGFESVVNKIGSAAWCSEPKRPSTRIWFGLRKEGYARETKDALRFGPSATRLFAKGSSDPSSGEKETEPNASYRRFIGWWDAHYSAVASWEPQYELLNQLMKWSVVTQQARISGKPKCASVLRDAPFGKDARLASWSAARPNLRWKHALGQFHATQTGRECLPIIRSETFASCGSTMELQGGVSAGSFEEVKRKPFLQKSTPRWLARLGGDADPRVTGDRAVFTKLERGGGGELTDVELRATSARVRFFAKVDTSTGQVGTKTVFDPDAPVKNVEKVVERHGNTLTATESANGLLRAGLTAYDLNLAKVRVQVQPGLITKAQSFGQRVSNTMARDAQGLDRATAAMPGLRDAKIIDGEGVAFRFEDGNSPKFVFMSSGTGVRGPPADVAFITGSWQGGRVGDFRTPATPSAIQVRIVGEQSMARYLSEHPNSPLAMLSVRNDAIGRIEQALAAGNVTDAAATVKQIVGKLDVDSLTRLNRVLEKGSVQAARRGTGDELALLQFSVALEARRRAPAEPGEEAALASATRLVVPVDRPVEAALPPLMHPPHKVLKPEEQYVSRVVMMPETLARSSTFEDAGGARFRVRALKPVAGMSKEQIGSGLRVATAWRTAVTVVSCDNANASLPRCTPLATPAQQTFTRVLVTTICAELDDARKATCTTAANQCDTDQDNALASDAELACLRRVAKQFSNVPPPTR